MKKLLIGFLISLILTGTAISSERACQPIWDKVAGHSFTVDNLEVVFSEAYAGPCPQGVVEVFQGTESLGTFRYMTQGDNEIVIADDLIFVLVGNDLIYITPDTLILEAE